MEQKCRRGTTVGWASPLLSRVPRSEGASPLTRWVQKSEVGPSCVPRLRFECFKSSLWTTYSDTVACRVFDGKMLSWSLFNIWVKGCDNRSGTHLLIDPVICVIDITIESVHLKCGRQLSSVAVECALKSSPPAQNTKYTHSVLARQNEVHI